VNSFTKFIDRFGNISVRVQIGNHHTEAGVRETGFNHNPETVASDLRLLANEIEQASVEPTDEEIDQMLLKKYGKTAQQLADEAEAGYDLS
jgi:hypothetical protein